MKELTRVILILVLVFLSFWLILSTVNYTFPSTSKIDNTGQPVPLVFDVLETSNQVRVWKINVDGVYYLLASNNHGGVTLIPFDE